MLCIISSSEDAVVAMTEKIKPMKVSDFPGEDVTKVTGQLKMAIIRLEVLSKVPEDLEKTLLGFFKQLQFKSLTLFLGN